MEQAASLIRQHGFDVVRVGRRGVSVRADDATFLRELGVVIPANGSLVQPPLPNQPLSRWVDLVEAAPQPISF